MKIAVLGATGPTGLLVVEQALERGHEVVALVRNPEKIKLTNPNLKVMIADIFSVESLASHLPGCDAVISCLGSHSLFSSVTLYSDTIKIITEAMKTVNCVRLLVISSWWVRGGPDEPVYMKWLIKPLLLGRVLADMDRMESFLEEKCQDLDFTSVRAPQLTNDVKDKEVLAEEALFVQKASYMFQRYSLAKFMLDCVEGNQYTKKCVSVGHS